MQPEWSGSASEYLGQQGQAPPQQMAQGPPPGPPGTLGQVADTAAASSAGGDLSERYERYNQMLGFAMRTYQPLMRQPLPEPQMTPARVLANIVTFGGVGVADSYRRAYNERIRDRNDKLTLAAHRDAMDLVEKQAEIEALGGKQNMALLGLQMRLMGLEQQARDSQLQQMRWQYDRQTGLLKPPTEGEVLGAEPYGGTFVPGQGWRYNDPASGSPLEDLRQQPEGSRAGEAQGADVGAGAPPPRTPADLIRERKRREAEEAEARKPLDAEGQTIVSGMSRARELIHRALTEFKPEERRKYVGVLRNPAKKWEQLFQGDPRFQEWQALTKQLEQIKFSFGGKTLTQQENDIIKGFLPTGSEWGGGDEFDVKAKEFYRQALGTIRSRLQAAKGRGALEQEFPTTTTPTTTAPPPAGTSGNTMSVEEWLAR